MGVFRTKFVTENVRKCGETGEKRERERERLKTLPYMPNFQKKPSIDSREPQGSVSNVMNGPKMWNGGISFKKNAGVRRRKQNRQFHTTFARY